METRRQRCEKLRNQLEYARSSYITHWKEIAAYMLPRRPRWTKDDHARGTKLNQSIIDGTATAAIRTLGAGMNSGLTSPSRPWMKLTISNPFLAEELSVKVWLEEVTRVMLGVFGGSNLYKNLPALYEDMGTFGTGVLLVEEDFGRVIHSRTLPIGTYCIANGRDGRVNILSRTFPLTIRETVEEFAPMRRDGTRDMRNVSSSVQDMYTRNQTEATIEIAHILYPNDEYKPDGGLAIEKMYRSCYYELGGPSGTRKNEDDGKFLRESGYDQFPALCGRWRINGQDAYGSDCPGMLALGDVKALQAGEKISAQAIQINTRPPMLAPSSMRRHVLSAIPGETSYYDDIESGQGIRPMYEAKLPIADLESKQEQTRQRIKRFFYEDLFLMLTESDRRDFTATEILERREEKSWTIGPVIENATDDVLERLIDVTFYHMLNQGLVPEPPQELSGMPLVVEFVSVLAQAQKLVGLGNTDRFIQTIGQIAQFDQSVLDKVNMDAVVDVYGDMTGVSPKILRSDEEVAAMREQRAKQAQAQQAMATIQQGAGAAKDLSGATVSDDNLLGAMTGAGAG